MFFRGTNLSFSGLKKGQEGESLSFFARNNTNEDL